MKEALAFVRKRKQVIAVFSLVSSLVFIFTIFWGFGYLSAVDFLIQNKEITPLEMFRTIRLWFWAIIASVVNVIIIFIACYLSDSQLLRTMKKAADE